MNNLVRIKDIQEYLDEVNRIKKDSLIIMVVKDTPGSNMGEEELNKIHEIGFSMFSNQLWIMYIGVIYKGDVCVNLSGKKRKNPLSMQVTLDAGLNLDLTSQAWKNGNSCRISINDKDYAVNLRGINIVTFDGANKMLLDSVAYDSHEKGKRIFRRNALLLAGQKYINKCSLSEILPPKIKVRIIYWGGAGGYFWNVFHSIACEFMKGERFDVKVISYYNDPALINILEKNRIEYGYLKEWDVEEEKPEIIIFAPTFTYLGFSDNLLQRLRAYSKLLVSIPLALIFVQSFGVERLKQFFFRSKNIGIDYVVLDALMYRKCRDNNINDDFIVEIGNPKFDKIYSQLKSKQEIPREWGKLNNKRVVLWLVDHDWQEGSNVSFDLYAKAIFSYFQNEPEMALIFRPHPVFVRDMLHYYKIWKQSDVDELHRYIDNSKNIIWDELPDYSLSYQLADAMLMEIGTGTILSALSTKKPIAILFRNDCKPKIFHPELTDNYYHCYTEADLIDFLEKMKQNIDPMKDDREKAFEKYISHFDGKNGQRIKKFIYEKYTLKSQES